MPRNKVTLFGGAFDPPHLGHQQVTAYLLKEKISDQVWYVPVKQHPFGKDMALESDRLAMLDLILEPNTRIEKYELHHAQTSYTAWTLEALSRKHPEITFSWIIGSDNLPKFDQWGGDIFAALKKHTFYVYPRKDYPFEPLYQGMVPLPEAPLVTVTSTEIRQSIKEGAPIAELLDPGVEKYIRAKNLYN